MHSLKVNAILILSILLWASAFVGIKLGLAGYSPGSLALLRFLVASVCMLLIYWQKGLTNTLSWMERLYLIIGGIAGIGVYNICLNFGEISVSAGIASFVIGLMPIVTILMAVVFYKEQVNLGVWIGIVLSFVGLLYIAWGDEVDVSMQQGIILIFISTVTGSVLTFIQKRFVEKQHHPIAIMSWVMWGGTLLLLVYLPDFWKEIKTAGTQPTLAGVYMGIFPAVIAYLAWTYVLKYHSASKVSISLYALPIISTLLGFILLDEVPTMNSLIGGAVALTGAFIANHYYEQPETESLDDDDPVAA